ncbi:MAG: HTH-type transcriptional regulator DmlR [Alphaproteobacteria bacterium ADurb.BinA305]|nr:MAG: HTH-type transcriptional regulator DmlR [Alphaproteobacteria bacterium ADurb.BinA305]
MIVPYMEQIDPNDLLVFARVVAEGSLTAAADKLGLPKSTVSRRLSRLEEQLGERLLLRTTRRLNITEFGAALLDHARQLESEVEAVAALAESRQARPSGRLRVSMPSDFANLLLTDMLAAFAALHPAVTLELDLSPRRVDLLGENFDLAIRLGDLPDDALLAARRLAVFPWGLYAAPAAAAGITTVPEYFAAPHVQRGELRRVLPDWRPPSIAAWAVFPGRRLMPAKTRAFLDMLQAALGGDQRG